MPKKSSKKAKDQAPEFVITEEEKEKLSNELRYLENEKRAEVGERIRVARDFGDISENSEYDDAKNEQGMIEARITELNHILSHSKVASNSKRSIKVNIGSRVKLKIGSKEIEYTIVGVAGADASAGKISSESPIGSAVLNKKKGDKISYALPNGRKNTVEILKIMN
ncbi:MAG: transcription elongation factor GreA [Eggerthellaceae bacterium]|nr:transcription elongation factor GreA [Eggerthellaceae bacterium]